MQYEEPLHKLAIKEDNVLLDGFPLKAVSKIKLESLVPASPQIYEINLTLAVELDC
ncbi:MAG: hypothetical protein FWG64_02185 [Firmicutes bacterium]|nr:hypothetical protein [Bacillota bacterium]